MASASGANERRAAWYEAGVGRLVRPWRLAVGALVLAAVAALLVFAALRSLGAAGESVRCPAGTHPSLGRCCALGQEFYDGACRGVASRCAVSQELTNGVCVTPNLRLLIPAGTPGEPPPDWQPASAAPLEKAEVASFRLDRTEVSEGRWAECATAGRCAARHFVEAALPVTTVAPEAAREFCRFAGGDLPTAAQWLLAAAGTSGRRFPWGTTGLVCRRAAFGLVHGPCAFGATGPETVGSRPDGATPEGILDLSGNVAEWTLEADGAFAARGGSFVSQNPARLKSWAVESRADTSEQVGFRCAYSRQD